MRCVNFEKIENVCVMRIKYICIFCKNEIGQSLGVQFYTIIHLYKMKLTNLFFITIFSIGFSKPVEKNQPTVWYYFGRNGINSCGEPDPVFPCTVEMHIVHTLTFRLCNITI